MNVGKKILTYIANLPRLYSIGGGIIIVAVVLISLHVIFRQAPAPATPPQITHVQLASVSSLSNQAGPLQVTGNVVSKSEATVLSETSGQIVALLHSLGDQVSAGEEIAQFENSSQQAAVLQAQGAYEAAQAALAQASGTTAQNSGVTAAQASQAAQNAQTSALAALQSTYAALDDAVHAKSDPLFNNPRSTNPTLAITVPDSQLIATLQNERLAIEEVLQSAQTDSSDTASADIDANATALVAAAQTVATFENNLVQAINEAVPNTTFSASTITGYQTTVGAARTEVVNAITSLTAAKNAYDSAASGAVSAANTASSGTEQSIAAAQANVKSAQGALDAAQSALEKTIIRSPISGTIVSLPITLGDYVSSLTPVAQISNPNALEVDTYVTSSDAKTLAVGGAASIGGTANGVITFIAPALDPTTGKIEVKIGITGDQSTLTDGETVNVSLDRSAPAGAASAGSASTTAITIPIVAAKITPEGPVVFTVSSSTLVSNPVTFGAIVGDQVTIESGLSPQMDIVTDARGLSDGQTVIVDPSN